MLVNDVKIVGTSNGEEVVSVSITCLCKLETIETICDAIRSAMNDMGDSIDFVVSFKDMDI